MKTNFKWLFLALFALNFSFSQEKDEILLTVDGEPILTSEFLRVYNKNLDLVKDESQKDVDGYLKLFTEYQLKLKEAKRLKLDEDTKYLREFQQYKRQLTKNYLSENKVTDALVQEAYDRSIIDLNASHVLVRLDESTSDTLAAYNQILKLRDRFLNEGFDALRADVHNGQSIFVEDLGYFSAFKMVYDFETAAYNTPKGEISMPFRTQFGYHVVKINDRRQSRGTVTAAHIMIALQQKDSTIDPEERIKDIYKKIQQGESFASLAKQFSDDKSSAKNGGKLAPFKSGQLSSIEFEDQAFGLAENGDMSAPFKTAYGWHIVKRIDLEPNPSFEVQKPQLESKVKRDTRSKLINTAMVKELKSRYDIVENLESKTYFESILTDDFFRRAWKLPEGLEAEKTLFSINNKKVTYNDFGKHLFSIQRAYNGRKTSFTNVIEREYEKYFEREILQFREENLEFENEEFANILKEYRDGLLLFELMEKEVWNRASKDSTGLEQFYQKHKSNYRWNDRVEVLMASTADQSIAERVLKMMQNGKAKEEIEAELNSEAKKNIIFTSGVFDLNDNKLPTSLRFEKGIDKIYEHNDAFHVIEVINTLPAGDKTLEEARGNVVNDYQTQIENDWLKGLYGRFEVEVNKKALKAVKSKINNQ
ncbi:peptidylprolyl isomerase [Winogradskyella tangerina]|uniref:peptidylprolyl isomerase n=1 Tax=Winogradskyella tangerina TaxID=2023240 RepID=UPI001E360869|nr:peptidylprolyl isomerase [Winogradskyella tangerina]